MSTRMLLSSHYLHDYSDFYLDLMINSLHTFIYQILLILLWCSSWIGFRTFKMLFVLFAKERHFEVS